MVNKLDEETKFLIKKYVDNWQLQECELASTVKSSCGTNEIVPEILAKLETLIAPGLVSGLGTATPGGMCIEAAVSLATTGEFGDTPACVAAPDRAYAIRINDAHWSSPQAWPAALLPLAIAQIGTAGTDRTEWVRRLAEGTIRRVLPVILRAAAVGAHDVAHREALERAAVRCEHEGTGSAASAAATAAYADSSYGAAPSAAAAAASYATDAVLRLSVQVALDAYAAETPLRDGGVGVTT